MGEHVQAAERLSQVSKFKIVVKITESYMRTHQTLKQVIHLDDSYDTAHAYRAGELSDIGLHTLALQDYNTAIRQNSKDMANYYNRAEVDLVPFKLFVVE